MREQEGSNPEGRMAPSVEQRLQRIEDALQRIEQHLYPLRTMQTVKCWHCGTKLIRIEGRCMTCGAGEPPPPTAYTNVSGQDWIPDLANETMEQAIAKAVEDGILTHSKDSDGSDYYH